ncbi:MAG TPA: hypothetical protein VEF04_08505, partial [Blastocatellia bacterium]|nr:hypothetical protein [Blastocatellia bacterium]
MGRRCAAITERHSRPFNVIAVLSHHPRLLLVGILLMTAMLWIGGTRVGLGTDDYHYLHALAPIEGIGSVLAAFVRADANPQYWRPLANASLMLDFVLYGWNGAGYHVTNLALHILATALVFGFARRILNADVMASSMAALIFGLSASHDSNLLWVAARADILASIFLLLTLLLISSKRPQNVALSGLTYFLALCSKELALLLLPFLGVLFLVKRDEWRLKPALLAIGYLTVVAGAFWMLRADFTVPAAQADPMVGEGMTSIIFALKNLSYGLGYLLLPLDLASATVVLSRFRTEAFVIGGAALVTFALMFRPGIRSMPWKPFIIAAALGLVFSVVVAQSFERWRLYMPSVGVYMMLALLITRTIQASGRIGRSASMAFLIGLLSFHTYRALAEQHSWT